MNINYLGGLISGIIIFMLYDLLKEYLDGKFWGDNLRDKEFKKKLREMSKKYNLPNKFGGIK